jgi:dsRNA-specific ribonuclease
MYKKLKWNAIGLEKKTISLIETVRAEQKTLPENNLNDKKKLLRFENQLQFIIDMITKINSELIPKLESIFRLNFKTPELVMMALARPSIRAVYSGLHMRYSGKDINPLKDDDYKQLAASGDAADVLALIGDAALDLAIVEMQWDSSLSTIGVLTKKREQLAANKNLARVCDEWNLYDYRLKINEPSDVNIKSIKQIHEKGTLVESLYGVIYLDYGFEELLRTVPLIQ